MHPLSMVGARTPTAPPCPSGNGNAALIRLVEILGFDAGKARGGAFSFFVDGAAILAQTQDRHVRLVCSLGQPPRDEAALRGLMRRFFRHADGGAQILCVTDDGELALIAELADKATMRHLVSAFCDAAVHWSALTKGSRQPPADDPLQHRMYLIRP